MSPYKVAKGSTKPIYGKQVGITDDVNESNIKLKLRRKLRFILKQKVTRDTELPIGEFVFIIPEKQQKRQLVPTEPN